MYHHEVFTVQCFIMRLLLLLAGLTAVLGAVSRMPTNREFHLEIHDDKGYALMAIGPFGKEYLGHIGRQSTVGDEKVDFKFDYHFDEFSGGHKISVFWNGPSHAIFEDCIEFGQKQWFAGPEQKEQYWPIQNGRLKKYSIVSKEDGNAAISERYWLNSAGEYIYVAADSPLFVDYHNVLENHLCLIAEVASPYSKKRTHNSLKYEIWFFENAKIAHQHAVETYLGQPSEVPDYRMVQYPIWCTWARYSRAINHESVMEYANEIISHDFNNAQIVIDDLWEVCYGSLIVDKTKFPDLKQLTDDLKSIGFRVTMWMHPFINKDCDPWYTEALDNGYLVLNEEGSPDTTWWNHNGSVSAYIDFTKPDASEWYSTRVRWILDNFGVDSIKFDAGESSWSPQVPVQEGLDIDIHPAHIVQSYVRKVVDFGPMIEIRAGIRTQDLPVFVRMVDKDTYWGFNNGLATLPTTLLAMNLNGYTFVLPDMIGGNGYNEKPSKELFIRWLQANVFMPVLQFSFVPWDYDEETIEICHYFTGLHAEFSEIILAAMEASVKDGTPVNPPIWWIAPTDPETWAINDEFLLGTTVLAAPVLTELTQERDIYLPAGIWKDGNNGRLIQGPVWLRQYPAPLHVLPYFILED